MALSWGRPEPKRLQGARPVGPPTLYESCLAILSWHFDELLEHGGELLEYLPTDAKACLLALARRHGQLTDTAIALLADPQHYTFDVHDVATSGITSGGVLTACHSMPKLRYIDVRGVDVPPEFLRRLALRCPGLFVLRFGCEADECRLLDLGNALIDVLPKLSKPEHVMDSWEAAEDGASSILQPGRLAALECVVWNQIPHEIQSVCLEQAPRVLINPSREILVANNRMEFEFDQANVLDEPFAARIPGAWMHDVHDEVEKADEDFKHVIIPHIAQRFKAAYLSQERRLQKKSERLHRRTIRRKLERSGAERAIREWEADL